MKRHLLLFCVALALVVGIVVTLLGGNQPL